MKNIKLGNNVARTDWILWLAIGIILLLTIVANYHFYHQSFAIRLIGWIVGAIILVAMFFYTTQGQRFFAFAQASRIELRKVVWPTRQETVRTTMMVIAMVIVAGLFLWAIDSLLLRAVAFLTA